MLNTHLAEVPFMNKGKNTLTSQQLLALQALPERSVLIRQSLHFVRYYLDTRLQYRKLSSQFQEALGEAAALTILESHTIDLCRTPCVGTATTAGRLTTM
mmetsp:Transcript_696/g.1391  ORF Transcript_696/g.1391 Transcript_696/m.1391 type:complete len:100 (+) Transcript_696:1163-1462(+)